MICEAVAVRCSCGFSPMKKRAVLSVLPLPEPKNEPNAAMSGSLRQDLGDVALQALHFDRRDVLRGLHDADHQAIVLRREEALRDHDEQVRRSAPSWQRTSSA